jgi:hypothetical protein
VHFYADDANSLGRMLSTIKKDAKILVLSMKEIGLEINTCMDKIKDIYVNKT